MERYAYFLIGIIISIVMIKIFVPKPITVKLHPNLKNYNDVTYIDEEGKLIYPYRKGD